MNSREKAIMDQIQVELIKDKKFRNELSVALIREFVQYENLNVSEEDVSKRVKEILKEMVDIKFKSLNESEELDN